MKQKHWFVIGSFASAILIAALGYSQNAGAGQNRPATPTVAQRTAAAPAPGSGAAKAVLTKYCVTCHNDKVHVANFSLEPLNVDNPVADAERWERVIRKLRAGVMPPPNVNRPTDQEQLGLVTWLENSIDRTATPRPGDIGLHRLNRTEYANAIHDLLDLDIDPSQFLPRDDTARGFDNIAGSLTISPTLLESYVTAAAAISRLAVGFWNAPTSGTYFTENDASQNQHLEGQPLGTRGGIAFSHTFRADGKYKVSIQPFDLGRYIPGKQVVLTIDGEIVAQFPYVGLDSTGGADRYEGTTMGTELNVKAGSHTVGATFIADSYTPSLDLVKEFPRTSLDNWPFPQIQTYPGIGLVRIEGPFEATRPTDSKTIRKVFTCKPTTAAEEPSCAKQILSTLARRAYRRTETTEDMETLNAVYEQGRKSGGSFSDGIEFALQRLLVSPQFLIRSEGEPTNVKPGTSYRISDVELASRLSFFLWSTIPDEELISLANKKQLSQPKILEAQVRRMLADPKGENFTKNFTGQWLELRKLTDTKPDGLYFPDWDDEVRTNVRIETEMFFDSIVHEDRSIVDLLTADYTFLNERLAKHYGIPNVYGSNFRRVTLGPEFDYRRGLLGKGSFLAVAFAAPNRTSPVLRGKWVLENVLGSPPPDPPPNVPALEESANGHDEIQTLRDQQQIHMKNEPCKTCHSFMDPIGYSLENFDAAGKWRNRDRTRLPQGWVATGDVGSPINAQAKLFDGTTVNGPSDLRNALLKYSPQFVRNVTERLMIYGLGRVTEYYDMPSIRRIVRDAEKDNYKLSSIILGIVKSDEFLMRTKTEQTAANK